MIKPINLLICCFLWTCLPKTYGINYIKNDTLNDYEQIESKLKYYRNFLLLQVIDGNYKEVRQIINSKIYLDLDKDRYNETRLFFKNELHLIYYLIQDYDKIVDEIKYPTTSPAILGENAYEQILLPEKSDYFNRLVLLYYDNQKTITSDIDNATGVIDEEKSFLHLYLKYLLAQDEIKNINKEEIKKQSESFFNDYPNSPFESFIRNNIYLNFKLSKFGVGAGAYLGYAYLNGSLADYFQSYMPIGGIMDISYANLILNLNFGGSFAGKAKQGFTVGNDNWLKDMRISIVNIDATLGYAIVNNEKVRVYPYIGTGTAVYSSLLSSDTSLRKVEIRNHPTLTGGLVLDWKFRYSSNSNQTYKEAFIAEHNNSYGYIRMRINYTNPGFENVDNRFKGDMLFVSLGVGLFVNPAVQIKHK